MIGTGALQRAQGRGSVVAQMPSVDEHQPERQ